jgi:alpha-ribazole phosphatase/probable phosphoglycerate mutase
MTVKITYFVHSTSEDNINKISSGWNNPKLSEIGIDQANNLKEIVKDKAFDVVFSSDLIRAFQTAEIVFKDKKIVLDPRIRECNYGSFDGKDSHLVESLQETYIYDKFPLGESYKDVENRVSDFLKDLKKDYSGKTIAIVSHKAPQLALDVLLKKLSWEDAFLKDWRKTKDWKPGWDYLLE